MVGGPLTGASMNPAPLFRAGAGGFWRDHWFYWLAPVTAMIVAARVYDYSVTPNRRGGPTEAASLGVQGPIRESLVPGGRQLLESRAASQRIPERIHPEPRR